MRCHLDLEGPSSARGQTLFKGRKLPWKCAAVSVRLSSDSSQVAVTCELHLCSCLIDIHYFSPQNDKWNVESSTKMQKNQFIKTASLTGMIFSRTGTKDQWCNCRWTRPKHEICYMTWSCMSQSKQDQRLWGLHLPLIHSSSWKHRTLKYIW